MHVRRDVWRLELQQPWPPILLSYAKAVGELKARPASDPTSWAYQAAMHGTAQSPNKRGWNGCQHRGWFFLPWHRLYLARMESTLRAVVKSQGGPGDWALPYWDYDRGGQTRFLPPSFRAPTLPDGTPNALFVAQRGAGFNAGTRGLPDGPTGITSPALALGQSSFTPPPLPSFGGGSSGPVQFFHETGQLEQTPHNDVHVTLAGLMSDPFTAAQDPIFWLHHCNIDRVWSAWQNGGNADPVDAKWLTQGFDLFDAKGGPVRDRVDAALDTRTQLGYRYYRQSKKKTLPVGAVGGAPEAVAVRPETIGATSKSISLAGGSIRVAVPVDAGAQTESLRPEAAEPRRLYLGVEDIETDAPTSAVYRVFVDAGGDSRRYVGNVSVFGPHKARDARQGREASHGHRLVFDVTDAARTLKRDDLRGSTLHVTFEPITDDAPEAAAEAVDSPPIRIGRLSLFTS